MDNDNLWLGFTKDTPDEACITKFAEKFGYVPEKIVSNATIKLAGPIKTNT